MKIIAPAFALILAMASASVQAVILRIGFTASPTHPCGIAAVQFKTNVEKRTNGDVKIQIYGSNKLGPSQSVLNEVMIGNVDMSLSSQFDLSKHLPFYGVISTQFAFKDYATADKVIDGDFKAWAAPELLKKDLVHLSDWEWGFRQLTNNKRPINSPADTKGLMFRLPPADAYKDFVEAAGGSSMVINFAELKSAINNGMVDGQDNPIGTFYDVKLYEIQKYVTVLNYSYESLVHIISKKGWEKLTPEQQKIVMEESASAAKVARSMVRNNEATQLKDMESKGVAISRPDLGPWKAAMNPAWEKVKSRSGADNFKRFMDMVEKNK